jgi:hypothetical protein
VDAADAGFGFNGQERGIHGVFDGDRTVFDIAAAGFEIGKREQIGRDVVQADGMSLNHFDEAAVVLIVGKRAAEQRFRVSPDGRKGSAHFVRDIGHEIAPHALQTLEAGDVMQNHERAAVIRHRQGSEIGFEDRRIFPGELQFAALRLAGGKHAGDEAKEARVAHQPDEGRALGNGRPEAKRLGQGVIAEHHAHLMIHGENAFRHALEDGVAAGGFETEAVHQLADA